MIKKFRLQTVDTSLTIHHLKGHIYFRFCLRSEVIEAGIWIQVGTHSHKCMSLVGAAFCTASSPILGWRSPEVSGSLSRKQSAGTRGIRTPWHTVQSVNLNCESVDWINLWAQTCSNTVYFTCPWYRARLWTLRALPYAAQFVTTTFRPEGNSAEILVLFAAIYWEDREGQTLLKSAQWLRLKKTNLLYFFPPCITWS